MSILNYPRINFSGVISCNPCTTNNDDVMPTVVNRETDDFGKDLADKDDKEALEYMRTTEVMQNFDDPAGKNDFPLSGWNLAGDHKTSFLNTRITSVINEDGSQVTSASDDSIIGKYFNITGSDNPDKSGAGSAVMVDLDHTGLVTTQIFVGGIQFMDSDGSDILQLFHDTRAYQNWLNFQSTVAKAEPNPDNPKDPLNPYSGEQNFASIGCVMQFVIPASALSEPSSSTSPGLKNLLTQAKASAGLVIRFRIMETEPSITDTALKEVYKDSGQWPPNPAYGYTVGTIGVHYANEPETETFGRKLITNYPRPYTYWKPSDGTPLQLTPGTELPYAPNSSTGAPTVGGPAPTLIGNAVALVQTDNKVISLDTVESFAKEGFRNPTGPSVTNQQNNLIGFDKKQNRADIGALELAVVDPDDSTKSVSVGDIDYGLNHYGTYENFGGIVDISFNPQASGGSVASTLLEAIQRGNLVIRAKQNDPVNGYRDQQDKPSDPIPSVQDKPSRPLAQEDVIRVVTDDRAMYTILGQTDLSLDVKVYERGGPTTKPVTLYLKEYKNIIQIKGDSTCAGKINEFRTNQTTEPRHLGDYCIDGGSQTGGNVDDRLKMDSSVTIPAGEGYTAPYSISFDTAKMGVALINIQLDDIEQGQGVPAWAGNNYSSIRVFDDKGYDTSSIKWDDVYAHALRYYNILFPAMTKIIPLDAASSVAGEYASSPILERLGDPGATGKPPKPGDNPTDEVKMFWSTYNMPITRTMSPGKVNLIKDFIKQETGK
ncbi:MAG: hypothetical protein ABUK01_02945 [Leptospirales bacterium]